MYVTLHMFRLFTQLYICTDISHVSTCFTYDMFHIDLIKAATNRSSVYWYENSGYGTKL